jgi:hypothetical protein
MTRTTRIAGRLSLLTLSAGLFLLAAPLVFAQHTDPAATAGLQNLTFAAHANTVFTGPTGLEHASQVLQRCDAISAPDQDVACNITLAQEGEIGTFGAAGDGLDVITTAEELDAVLNNAAAYVKVVTSIEFCDGVPGTFTGCSRNPGSSIVIVAGLDENTTGEVIAHQFGHNKGLPDRTTPGNPLMNPAGGGNEVNLTECAALHVGLTDNGPNVQQDFPPVITCPADAVIECSASGGTPKADPQLATFFTSVVADDGCEAAPTVTNDAPDLFPVGVTTVVTFTATDSTGNTATCTASVTVNDTTPPIATCPADALVECSATGGTPKTDPQLVPFFAGASATDICDPAPVLTNDAPDLFPLGSTDVIFSATDGSGNVGTCTAAVDVADTTPPVTTVALDRYSLWPPNHKLVTIFAEVGVTDICDANPTFTLLSIESNETENGNGDGNTSPDIVADVGTPDTQFQLRAERSGGGSGRAYTIVFQGADLSGNTSDAETCVAVPHDQSGHGDVCSGPLAKKRKGHSRSH